VAARPIKSPSINTYNNTFDLNIHDYENNGSMTVALYDNGERINSNNYMLSAFNGEECVGYTQGLIFPLDGNMIFPLMVYGDEDNVDLTFKVYDQITGDYYDIDEKLSFTIDMRLGNGNEPVILNIINQPIDFKLHEIFPNPFNPTTTIKFDIPIYDYVSLDIYNLQGRFIQNLYSDYINAGKHEVIWDASEKASGIYIVRLSSSSHNFNQKVTFLK